MSPRSEISAEELSLTSEIAHACRDNEVVIEALETKAALGPKIKDFLRDNALLFLTMAGIVAGFALGFGIREASPSKDALMWLGMPGELFLRMLQMMILPLITCTVITGTASLDPRSNGKISAVAFGFIVSTNVIACVVAVLLCLAIKPGVGQLSASESTADQEPMETQDIFADILRDMFPDNMMEATFRKSQTQYRKETEVLERNSTNGTTLTSKAISLSKYAGKADGINVLGKKCRVLVVRLPEHKSTIFFMCLCYDRHQQGFVIQQHRLQRTASLQQETRPARGREEKIALQTSAVRPVC